MRELLGSTVFAVVGSRLFRSIRDARVAHAIFVRVLESATHVDAGVLVAYFQSVVSHSRSPAHVRRAHALVVDVIEGGLCSGDDATFWRKLVTVCASSSLSSHAFHHLRRLLKRGMPCDAVVLRAVVQALAGTRNWRLMHELVSLARVYSLDLDTGMCQQVRLHANTTRARARSADNGSARRSFSRRPPSRRRRTPCSTSASGCSKRPRVLALRWITGRPTRSCTRWSPRAASATPSACLRSASSAASRSRRTRSPCT